MRIQTIITALAAGGALMLGPAMQAGDGAIDVERLWNKNCKKCHGSDGAGKTRAGKKLKVGDYTDPAHQATFTDEEALRVTLEGILDDETGKEQMKPYKDELTAAEIDALLVYLRAFAKPPSS